MYVCVCVLSVCVFVPVCLCIFENVCLCEYMLLVACMCVCLGAIFFLKNFLVYLLWYENYSVNVCMSMCNWISVRKCVFLCVNIYVWVLYVCVCVKFCKVKKNVCWNNFFISKILFFLIKLFLFKISFGLKMCVCCICIRTWVYVFECVCMLCLCLCLFMCAYVVSV